MKWDLSNYYKTYEDFKKGKDEASELIKVASTYKGKLNEEKSFKEYYKLQIKFVGEYEKLYLYAECAMDRDRRDTKAVSDMQEIMFLFSKLEEACSFEESEVLSLDKDYVYNIINNDEELKQLKYSFDNIYRKKEHTPSSDAAKVIAAYSLLSNSGYDTYSSLSTADTKEHNVTLDNNEIVNVQDSNWTSLIGKSKSEDERKRIFEAEFQKFDYNKNTYASIYNSVLQADIALAKAKGFDNALEMHLYQNNIPVSLYHNLINVAHKLSPKVKEYYALRKKVLGVKEYHTYDRFLDLATMDDDTYSYEDAKKLFFESIEKFSDEFKDNAHEALKDGYVDVEPMMGKRSGAYSNSTPNTHPCILLNFNKTLDACFTLAHEAGHSIHSLFSQKYQPTMTQSYTIFVAEIASTFNEHNLLDHLLNKGTLSKNQKICLIQNALDGILSTFYRQTLFAEYEYLAHTQAENGDAITEDALSNIMIKLYNDYYGLDINKEIYKKYVWAYIHHFFGSPYYVYQYATSYSASLAIYSKVKNNEKDAFDNYLNLLKSGGSDYPVELVKKAGVDFTKTDALEAVVKRFSELLAELEKALD